MRDQIKSLAFDLPIRHGLRGVSFGDLAETLGTARANIHYHVGSKQKLVEEVLAGYVDDTLSDMRAVLGRDDWTLVEKIEATLEISRRPTPNTTTPARAAALEPHRAHAPGTARRSRPRAGRL